MTAYPSLRYPPHDGFASESTRTADWAVPGERLDRIGSPFGNYLFTAGTAWPQRGLPPSTLDSEYHVYEVMVQFPVYRGPAVEWFGQPGGGTQLYTGDSPMTSVASLLALGYLKEVPQ